jgi:hypothetical protein
MDKEASQRKERVLPNPMDKEAPHLGVRRSQHPTDKEALHLGVRRTQLPTDKEALHLGVRRSQHPTDKEALRLGVRKLQNPMESRVRLEWRGVQRNIHRIVRLQVDRVEPRIIRSMVPQLLIRNVEDLLLRPGRTKVTVIEMIDMLARLWLLS